MATFVQKPVGLVQLLKNLSFKRSSKLSGGRRNVYYYSFTKQLSQPIKKKPKFVTAEEALKNLKSGKPYI